MPTIEDVRKRKKALEKDLLGRIKAFEKDGVTIDYISINREPDEPSDFMGKSMPEVPSDMSSRGVTSVKIDLRIDLD